MKFLVVIIESVDPNGDSIIVYFQDDKAKQHFEIHCGFNAYELGVRKWEVWEFNIKFRNEVFEDTKTKVKTYWTHFDCNKAKPINVLGRK